MAKPMFKWVGGKTQLLEEITNSLPEGNRLFEPFVGGGAVSLRLVGAKYPLGVINDLNPSVVATYRQVKEDPQSLMDRLDEIRSKEGWDSQESYLLARFQFNNLAPTSPDLDRASLFLLLNRTGFNGMFRTNRKGAFNVPWGKHVNPKLYDRTTILEAQKVLQNCVIRNTGYREATLDAQPGDVVYFDPPYHKVSDTSSFSSYFGVFGPQQQIELANYFRQLVDKGVGCVLSNSHTAQTLEWYRDFNIKVVGARRNINSKGDKRGEVSEILVSSIPLGADF